MLREGEIRATWTSSPSTTPAYKMPLYQYIGQATTWTIPLPVESPKQLKGRDPHDYRQFFSLRKIKTMNFFLSYRQMPEFANLLHDEAIKRYRICYLKSFLHWGQWVGIGFIVLFIFAWNEVINKILLLHFLDTSTMNTIEDLLLILFSAIGALFYLLIVNQVIRSIYTKYYNCE
jgi:hypothetical protein